MHWFEDEDEVAYVELTPEQALAKYEAGDAILLDVRTYPEWFGMRVPGALHIPMDELTARYQELDPEREILVLCAHGIRSAAAGHWLCEMGFENVANVRHGISRWPGPVQEGR